MITPYGALVTLAREERLVLAGAFTVAADDASPAVGEVLRDWCHALGCKVALLSSWTVDDLDEPALAELVTLLRRGFFWGRAERLAAYIGRRHDLQLDRKLLGGAVGELLAAVVHRRERTDLEAARRVASAGRRPT